MVGLVVYRHPDEVCTVFYVLCDGRLTREALSLSPSFNTFHLSSPKSVWKRFQPEDTPLHIGIILKVLLFYQRYISINMQLLWCIYSWPWFCICICFALRGFLYLSMYSRYCKSALLSRKLMFLSDASGTRRRGYRPEIIQVIVLNETLQDMFSFSIRCFFFCLWFSLRLSGMCYFSFHVTYITNFIWIKSTNVCVHFFRHDVCTKHAFIESSIERERVMWGGCENDWAEEKKKKKKWRRGEEADEPVHKRKRCLKKSYYLRWRQW